ncbi:MAG: hypothetical protein J1E77_01165, partial [Prevotella sp.]|nr:hypothetical protein [Prevotella sp.]
AIDCLKKLQSMGLHDNSWHYIVKVWKPVGENPTAEELRFLRYQIEEHGQLGKLHFCLAHDENLRSGETKMFVVTHYNERCWPPSWELGWQNERNELSLSQIKKRLKELRKTIDEEVLEPFRDEVWNDLFWGGIYSICYSKERTWRNTLEVLEYFKNVGSPIVDGIRHEAKELNFALVWKSSFSRGRCAFHLRKLKWLLENGADVNAHFENYTALDYLIGNYKTILNDKFSKKDEDYIKNTREKAIALLVAHGAKTMQQLKEEESQNEDYRIELQKMG